MPWHALFQLAKPEKKHACNKQYTLHSKLRLLTCVYGTSGYEEGSYLVCMRYMWHGLHAFLVYRARLSSPSWLDGEWDMVWLDTLVSSPTTLYHLHSKLAGYEQFDICNYSFTHFHATHLPSGSFHVKSTQKKHDPHGFWRNLVLT